MFIATRRALSSLLLRGMAAVSAEKYCSRSCIFPAFSLLISIIDRLLLYTLDMFLFPDIRGRPCHSPRGCRGCIPRHRGLSKSSDIRPGSRGTVRARANTLGTPALNTYRTSREVFNDEPYEACHSVHTEKANCTLNELPVGAD